MSDRFKITWNGSTRVLDKTPENFAKLEKMRAAGETFSVEPYEDAPTPAAGEYVDEMNVLGSNKEPLPAAPKPAQKAVAPSFGVRQFTDGAKSVGQTLLDAYRGLTHAATLGFDDELVGLVGGSDAAQQVRAANDFSKQRSPWANATGDAVGTFIPAAATAGASSIPALASRLAAAGPAATALIENTALGALQGAGNAESGDKLRGALTGGAVGAGFGAAGTGLGGAAKLLNRASIAARTAVGGANKTMMKGLRERYDASEAENAVGNLLEKHFGRGPARSADDYLRELQTKLGQGRQAIAAVDDAVAASGANAYVPEAWERFGLDQAAKAGEMANTAVGANAKREANSLQGAVKQIMTRNAPKRGAAGPVQLAVKPEKAPATFSELREKVGQYGDDAYGAALGRKESAESESAKQMWQRAKDAQSDVLSTVPSLRARYDQTNQDFSELKTLEHILDSTARGEQSGHLGTDLAAGLLTGLTTGTLGGLASGSLGEGIGYGIMGAAGSGTNSIAKRWANSSMMRDRLANYARNAAGVSGDLGTTLRAPAATLASNAVRGQAAAPYTSAGRAMKALRENPSALGPYAQKLAALSNDEDKFARLVEQLEQNDPNFASLVNSK